MEQFYAIRESARRLAEEAGPRASPDSWDGAENDPVWQEMRANRDRVRGRR